MKQSGGPDVMSGMAHPCPPSNFSDGEKHLKNESEVMEPTQIPAFPPTPPPPPPPISRRSCIAYACASHHEDFYKLGNGVEHIYKGRHECWLHEVARDIMALFGEAFHFRRRPDPYADLRRRGPIMITVETRTTITVVRH
jgi:hypothetical protein